MKRFILFMIVLKMIGCHSVKDTFIENVSSEFKEQPIQEKEILTEKDLNGLPTLVQKYLRYTGSIGKEKIQNFRLEFYAEMRKTNESAPMKSDTIQYNFYTNPARHFYLETSMFLIPARVLHSYSKEKASMQVRIANLFNITNISGEELSKTETLTLLNDLCFFAPAALIDKRIQWETIDDTSVKAIFQNGRHKVTAVLFFNKLGELINFTTDERGALQDDNTMKYIKWSTPIGNYKDFNGRKVATYGEAIYHYPEGDLTYGKFFLRKIDYNVKEF